MRKGAQKDFFFLDVWVGFNCNFRVDERNTVNLSERPLHRSWVIRGRTDFISDQYFDFEIEMPDSYDNVNKFEVISIDVIQKANSEWYLFEFFIFV